MKNVLEVQLTRCTSKEFLAVFESDVVQKQQRQNGLKNGCYEIKLVIIADLVAPCDEVH